MNARQRETRVRLTAPLLLSILLAAAIGLSASGAGSTASATVPVPWGLGYSLAWSDFRGPPPADAASRCEAAAIFMTLSWRATYTVSYDARSGRWQAAVDAASLVVTNTMDPRQSWVLASAQRSDVLRHEQRHFDLNEVYRRQLIAALSGLRAQAQTETAAEQSLRTALDQTSNRILTQASDAQSRYDSETGHGTDVRGQATWDATIASWLASSSAPLSGQPTPSAAGRSG